MATVDESAITGESAPVIRESGGDRSAVTGGTTVLSDGIAVRITTRPGETFIDRMIALVEGAARQKTPNEIALTILLTTLTIIFLLAVMAIQPLAVYSGQAQSVIVLVALLVCLIPTTIGALLSAIGIAGMDRLVQHNVLAMSGRAVEAAGDVSTLLLDKTGTITFGNRRATALLAAPGLGNDEIVEAAYLSSLADETPEGRSIVELAATDLSDGDALAPRRRMPARARPSCRSPRRPACRASTCRTARVVRKGASDAVCRWVTDHGGEVPSGVLTEVDGIASSGGTPLVVAAPARRVRRPRALGVVHLKDVVKPGMKERFAQLRTMGIRTVMITGDNPLTARSIAEEAGVDDFLAEATPEDKMALIRQEQEGGRLVAMTGDGTNDAPALAQSDVGVAMNTGTSAAKEAANMVDLDSDPTKLIDIVSIGKQLLITRGALTTFSIANDIAKYFAIIPAMFVVLFPGLDALNIMGLSTPKSAMLSAVIFNALIIVALIPLSLRGVRYRPSEQHRAAATQPPRLRRRRHHRPLHRHQADRPRREPPPAVNRIDVITMTNLLRQSVAGLRAMLVLTVLLGVALPRRRLGRRPARRPRPGGRLARHGRRPRRRLAACSASSGRATSGSSRARRRATTPATSSGGSNLGPGAALDAEVGRARRQRPASTRPRLPADALTASASGLDPHITPAYAAAQVGRVARGPRPRRHPRATPRRRAHRGQRSPASSASRGSNVLELNLALARLRRCDDRLT